MNRMNKRGFTLVEILIVVIILGILAAIVIPQFSNASQDARRSSMTSQLQTLRSQIELFKLQHKDKLPGFSGAGGGTLSEAEFWRHLTTQTDVDGAAYVSGTSTSGPFGPYLQNKSKNNMVDADDATKVVQGTDASTPADNQAYLYDFGSGTGTGKIWAVSKPTATTYAIFAE